MRRVAACLPRALIHWRHRYASAKTPPNKLQSVYNVLRLLAVPSVGRSAVLRGLLSCLVCRLLLLALFCKPARQLFFNIASSNNQVTEYRLRLVNKALTTLQARTSNRARMMCHAANAFYVTHRHRKYSSKSSTVGVAPHALRSEPM
jgi:hypothetical protein